MVEIISKPPLMTQHEIRVFSRGENVVMAVGNSELEMHYEEALKVSTFLRVRAKEAKRLAGDNSRHWSVIGIVEDLNAK